MNLTSETRRRKSNELRLIPIRSVDGQDVLGEVLLGSIRIEELDDGRNVGRVWVGRELCERKGRKEEEVELAAAQGLRMDEDARRGKLYGDR